MAARTRMDALTLGMADSFTNYTLAVRLLLGVIRRIGLVIREPAVLQALDAYIALLEGKEKAGQERATGSGAFAAGYFAPDVLQRFIILGLTQAANFAAFMDEAQPAQAAVFEADRKSVE